jgi:iron complex transport system substrate-binding protein
MKLTSTQSLAPQRIDRRVVFAMAGRWTVGLATVFALMGAATANALQVTDDRGVTLSFAQPPQRIVSLLPALTETVCALGQCLRLVGVDRYSNYPASVRALPRVGGGLDPNIEAIVALKPDLVLMATSARLGERLQALGIQTLALEPKSHADVQRVLEKVGQILGLSDANRVWRGIDAELSLEARRLPDPAKNMRVYFEADSAFYAASDSSFMGETLRRLGLKNIVPASLGLFPKLNPEYVVRADPDLLMVGEQSYANMAVRPGWAKLRAVKTGRICVFNAAQLDAMVRPGPRIAEAAHLMVQCVQGLMKTQGVSGQTLTSGELR